MLIFKIKLNHFMLSTLRYFHLNFINNNLNMVSPKAIN
jgi:hypothetical protein